MSVYEVGKSLGKGLAKDVARHHQKVMDHIKKGVADIIANEDIITGDRKRKVRVRIQSLKDYYLKFKRDGSGVGSGEGGGSGSGGSEDGVVLFDAEFSLEELIDIALEDCGLPNLKKKDTQEFEALLGYKIKSIEKTGIRPLMDKRKTARAAIQRLTDYLVFLKKNTGCSEQEAKAALDMCKGDLHLAFELLKKVKRGEATLDTKLSKRFFMSPEDYRFLELEDDTEMISNAVIIFARDWSGSMGEEKKYLTRMACFWLSEAIKRLYRNVSIVFMGHSTEAEVVSEEDFFKRAESGGTRSASVYELARKKIVDEFPLSRWNSYVFHFSDGDDFKITEAGQKLEELLKLGINLFCYGEINEHRGSSATLIDEYKNRFNLKNVSDKSISIDIFESATWPFIAALFSERKHLHQLVKQFLKKERSTKS